VRSSLNATRRAPDPLPVPVSSPFSFSFPFPFVDRRFLYLWRPSVRLSVCPFTQSGSPGGNTDVASVRFDPAVRGSINLSTNRRFLYLWCASVRLSVPLGTYSE